MSDENIFDYMDDETLDQMLEERLRSSVTNALGPDEQTYLDRAVDALCDADGRGIARQFGRQVGRNPWLDRACLVALRGSWYVTPAGLLTDEAPVVENTCGACGVMRGQGYRHHHNCPTDLGGQIA